MVIALETFDGLEEGTPVTTAQLSSGFGVTNTPSVASSSAAMHGDRGAKIVAATTPSRITWSEGTITVTRVWSWYFRVDNPVSASVYLGEVSGADWRINSDQTVTIRNGTSATGGPSPQSLQAGTWYRAEWKIDAGSHQQELRIFEGESQTPYITRSGAYAQSEYSTLACGVTASPNGISLSIDTIRVGDDWMGPYGAPAEPLATPSNFQFIADPGPNKVQITASWGAVSGASMYELEVEVRDGESWVAHDSYRLAERTIALTEAHGLAPGTNYRGRVRALPPGW